MIFLDDDAVSQPGWIAGLTAHYSDPHVLGVGGRLDPGWETGVGSGLAAERTYTRVTLPAGVLRGLGQSLRGDMSGLLRAGAIIVGLGYTTVGYIVGSVALRRARLRGSNR